MFLEDRPVLGIQLPGRKKIISGKVREVFDDGDGCLLMVATDRISAFDVVMNEPIPDKGKILTAMSAFWFCLTTHIVPNHFLTIELKDLPAEAQGRTMKIKRCKPLAVECIVRGYLAGSAWKQYQETGSVNDCKLPVGLMECQQLTEAIFTPTTKARRGHDLPLTTEQACEILGKKLFSLVREKSLELYDFAHRYAKKRGILIADTKFEFGLYENELMLIDELLTPDSSRFWPIEEYRVGRSQPSFDKQYLRDYLENTKWDKKPPPPKLPQEVINNTRLKYIEAYEKITGNRWLCSHEGH